MYLVSMGTKGTIRPKPRNRLLFFLNFKSSRPCRSHWSVLLYPTPASPSQSQRVDLYNRAAIRRQATLAASERK